MSDGSNELKDLKQETDAILEAARKREDDLIEKYEPAVKKILELIKSQCESNVEAHGSSAHTSEDEQPRFEINENAKAA